MRRRDFIEMIGGTVVAWPLPARAQQADRARGIGILMANDAQSDREGQARIAAFIETFQRLGWTNGRNAAIEYRWGAGDVDRGKALAAELVRTAPDVIVVAGGNPVLAALQRLTSTIPIVFAQISDPVESGFVASLAHPGGNLTGFTNFESAMGGKWLGVLKEAAPNMRRAAVLFGSDSVANAAFLRVAETVALSLGVEMTAVDIHQVEMERAIAAFAEAPGGGLIVAPHPYTVANRGSIIILAARYRLPAVYPYRYFATEGGLMSYGPDQLDQWRGAAGYVDRILRGEKPGELPVQAPTRFELVINMKTAKALGFDIPPAFPLRADEVIE